MTTTKIKKYTFFVGIDISRDELDFAIFQNEKFLFHKEIKNSVEDILTMVADLKKLPKFAISKCLFGMEQTGIYSFHLKTALKKVKANIVIEDAMHIRMSSGNIRGKNDKVDAIRIAEYLYKNRATIRLFVPKRDLIERLAHLMTLRNRLLNISSILTNPINDQASFTKKANHALMVSLCKESIKVVANDAKKLNNLLLTTINSDPNTKRLFDLITSVPSVGTITSIQIIISTNEFITISNPKKFACFVGVAPFKKDSGKMITKARVSHFADKKLKVLLHLCALSAIRVDEEIKAYYLRKTKVEGKPKMAVVNAVRNKLVLRIFACVNQNRPFERDYQRLDLITIEKETDNITASELSGNQVSDLQSV